MAEQSAFLTAFDEMQKKKLEQQGFNAPAQMESVVDTVGQAPAVESPFSQQAAAATDPLATPVDLSGTPAVQAPPSLVTDNPFAPSVGVSEPTVPQDAQDATERARIEDRLARTNADIIASGETVGGVEKEAFKPMGGGFSFGGNTPIPADRTDSFIPVVNEILKRTGASEFEDQGKAQVEAPSVDPFGVTSSEIAAAGNQNFGRAVSRAQPENPYRTQYGVNSLDRGVIDEIQQQDVAAPQAQLPSTIQNANGQNLAGFKPKYEGQSLTDFMAGRDDPSAASVQVQDPQGRFRRQAAPVAGETPEQNQARTDALFPEQADFREESAAREARQAARPDFGDAQERAAGTVTDAERRGGGISDADRRDIAKAQSPSASESERARGMKVAERAGLDWKTGQPIKQDEKTGGLTDYQAITAQQRQTEIEMKIAEGMEEKEAKRVVEYEESRNNVRSTRDSFEKLKPVAKEIALLSGSKFTEGALGWTASKLPFSTDAAQIERLTTEFEGSAFLQGLIDAKAKGATFGALSEREGDRILGQWGKITSPKSTNKERIRAINSMLDSIQRSSERAASDHKEKFPELSVKSEDPQAQGSTKGSRYPDDQDYGAKVETYFQGK